MVVKGVRSRGGGGFGFGVCGGGGGEGVQQQEDLVVIEERIQNQNRFIAVRTRRFGCDTQTNLKRTMASGEVAQAEYNIH